MNPKFNYNMREDVLNSNSKRPLEDSMEQDTDIQMVSDSVGGSLKQLKIQNRIKKLKAARQLKKASKPIVWSESVQPVQLLNEKIPNIEYQFDTETREGMKAKYLCTLKMKLEPGAPDSPLIDIQGDGLSKKDAKKKAAFLALCHNYPDSFKPSPQGLEAYNFDYTIKKTPVEPTKTISTPENGPLNVNSQLLAETRKRWTKFVNNVSIKAKTSTQLLHELCVPLAETGKLVGENETNDDKKYTYEYRNVFINIDCASRSDSNLYLAYGYGKSKKDAKQHAAKLALKQFLDIDMDQVLTKPTLPY